MFTDFFYALRDEGVPVGTQEWLLLLTALGKGLHGSSLVRFYHLARSVLVKSETYFDAYDRAFLKVFEGVEGSLDIADELLEWLKDPKNFRPLTDDERALLEKLSGDELMTIIGGPGFSLFFDKINELYGPWINAQPYHLTIKEISSKPLLFGEIKILSAPMAHLPGSVGYRIEWQDGKSLVISGDTDYCETIVNLASEAGLLVLECSFPDGKKVEGHLTPSLAGRIARESRCKRLLLTHLYPICHQYDILNQCRQVYPGEILLGEDLMKVEF